MDMTESRKRDWGPLVGLSLLLISVIISALALIELYRFGSWLWSQVHGVLSQLP